MPSDDLKAVLIEVQDSQNQHQLTKEFYKIYKSIPFDDFWAQFSGLIKHPLVVYAREPTVEKTIEFIAKAVTDVTAKDSRNTKFTKQNKENAAEQNTEDEEEEDDMHPLLLKLFEFLLDVHSAKERAIRFRVCQLITRLLHNLGEGAKIDDTLYDRVYQSMVERLRDKCPLVRVHAVLALTRLQDPTDESCPITKAYIILMTRDPNAEVRRIILTCLAPSTSSLSAILERTHDVKDTVRRTAYTVITEKIPLRALSIEQRVRLLQDGLSDRSEIVQIACSNKLLQAWLCACEGNILELLERLDVESSVKICEKALNILFKNSGILNLVQKFDLINDRALIDEDKLTCECAFYWRNLIQFIHGEGHDYEEQLDQVRPNCVEFCSYIKSFMNKMTSCSDVDEKLDQEFTLQQLLQILSFMDFSDQTSRKTTEKLLRGLLVSDTIVPNMVPHILPCLKQMHTEIDDLITCIAETISDIREPITTVETHLHMNGEAQRNIDKKIAGIRVKLHQLREELSESIDKQDFERAAVLKVNISNLDSERSSLLEESQPKLEEVRIQKEDAFTVLKCLTIVCELLMIVNVKTVSPTLHTLVESQILPGVVNEEAEVRNLAIKAIGLCCLIKKDIVLLHLPLLLQATQMDTQLVRATAVKSVFDLVHVFGLEAFSDDNGLEAQNGESSTLSNTEVPAGEDGDKEQEHVALNVMNESNDRASENLREQDKKVWSGTASKVITILSALLDNESSELRNIAAEGLAKLLLSGRVVSSKLLSHLLLLWYNPLVEDDEALLQILGIFFPLYAFSCSSNQQQVEETFMPTLCTLLRAPPTSPLAQINELSLATFLMELTDAQHLVTNQTAKTQNLDNPCHDSIAVKLCNEVLSHPDSFNNKLWLKVLNQLNVTPDNASLLKDLYTMCEDMAMIVTEKQCFKLLEKFRDTVENKLDHLKQMKPKTTHATDQQHAATEAGDTATCVTDAPGEKSVPDSEEVNDSDVGECGPTIGTASVAKKIKTTERKAPKTPAVTKSTRASSKVKSISASANKMAEASAIDDIVFATPAPLKGSRVTTDTKEARVNLENLLDECSYKTPSRLGKTPKTPKRPLHSIQDPKFTG